MKLLLVTDHKFVVTPKGVRDTYCFDHEFFSDYLAVFDEVTVAARMVHRDQVVGRAAEGPRVRFLALPPASGLRWALAASGPVRSTLRRAVADADAVCLRIPSVAAIHAHRFARRAGRPIMFEMIGDPIEAMRRDGGLRALASCAYGEVHAAAVRAIIRDAVAGSYVSFEHLQRRYPAPERVLTEPISSIRLPSADVAAPRTAAPGPQLRVILVASLMPVKRHDVLVRAIGDLRRRGVDAHLTLVGDGPERARIEGTIAELGLGAHVTLEGHVEDRARLTALLDRADVFAMPSRSEGMPRAMIEAMARGLPAFGSDVGGIAELLPADQRFPAGDHRALADRLRELVADPVRAAALSRRSHELAHRFDRDLLRQRRVRLLREVARHVGRRAVEEVA